MGKVQFELRCIFKNVDKACRKISITDEIQKFKNANPDKQPSVLIDLNALAESLLRFNYADFLVGGRFNMIRISARVMFESIKLEGCNLVFVVNEMYVIGSDANHVKKMAKTVNEIERTASEYVQSRFEHSNTDNFRKKLEDKNDDDGFQIFDFKDLLTSTLVQVAKDYGTTHVHYYTYQKPRNASYHYELAEKEGCFAVLGNNIYYLLVPGDVRYWCLRDIHFKSLVVNEFYKDAIINHFGLSFYQWSVLCAMTYECALPIVEKVYQHFGIKRDHFRDFLKSFIKLIKTLPEPIDLKSLIIDKFKMNQLDLLDTQRSIDMLNTTGSDLGVGNRDLEHIKSYDDFAYKILNNYALIIKSPMMDFKPGDWISYYNLVTPILRKTMGILLKQKLDVSGMVQKRMVIMKQDNKRDVDSVWMLPEYPTFNVPSLDDILSKDWNVNYPMKVIKWLVDWNLYDYSLDTIPDKYFTEIVILVYLLKYNVIKPVDAVLILKTVKLEKNEGIPKGLSFDAIVHGRTYRVSMLFLKFQKFFNSCLTSLGLGHLASDIIFDAAYYQVLSNRALDYRIKMENCKSVNEAMGFMLSLLSDKDG